MWGYVTRLPATTTERRVRLTSFPPRRPRSRTCRAKPGRNPITRCIPRQQPPLGNQRVDRGMRPLQRLESSQAAHREHRPLSAGVRSAAIQARPRDRVLLGFCWVPGTTLCVLPVFASLSSQKPRDADAIVTSILQRLELRHREVKEISQNHQELKATKSPLATTATQETGHSKTRPLSKGRKTQV